jgi:hypothetical protein
MLLLACRSGTRTDVESAAPSSSSPATPVPMMRVRMGDSFSPATGDSALRAFVPEVQPFDSAGECRVVRTSGSGATIVSAYFPSFDAPRTAVSLTFDSAGHLVRFSDRRGMVRYKTSPFMSDEQRDSVARAADAAVRSTSVNFDYAVDQALASNRGGGRPSNAVIASVRSMETLERLGPPIKRLERVRRLCGV